MYSVLYDIYFLERCSRHLTQFTPASEGPRRPHLAAFALINSISDSNALLASCLWFRRFRPFSVMCLEKFRARRESSRSRLMLIVGNRDWIVIFLHVIISRQVSAYPVILSLENHCSQEQQEVMAQYLMSILGDKLLRTPLDHPTTGDLPSPNVRLWKAWARLSEW